jgi:hypothetical protein
MICGLLAKMAITATILGQANLKIDNYDRSMKVKYCTTSEPTNANATVVLRDVKGRSIFESRIYVGQMDFYLSGAKRGGVPAKSVSILYSYPVNAKTEKVSKVELKIDGRKFDESAQLQSIVIGMK